MGFGGVINCFPVTIGSLSRWGDAIAAAMTRQQIKPIHSKEWLYEKRIKQNLVAQRLFEFGEHSATSWDLAPEIYYDNLIEYLYSNDNAKKSGVQNYSIFDKKIGSAFELYSVSAMSATDIAGRLAAAALGVVREDDWGNIIFENPAVS